MLLGSYFETGISLRISANILTNPSPHHCPILIHGSTNVRHITVIFPNLCKTSQKQVVTIENIKMFMMRTNNLGIASS